jgi:crotonobetainyl-CoA:carnitine CoA-transferase CaiB-like acyl-CoA transferase
VTALDGLKVLDFSTGIVGPVVGMFLADFGADVIKIEGPIDDPGRSMPGFVVWNRNKKSVEIDPEVQKQKDWLVASIRGADVCILGAAMELADWGDEVSVAASRNPELITLRLPAYLDGSTPWAGDDESNGLLSAAGGQAMRQSSNSGGPIESVSPYLLYVHGIWATTCLVAALVERTVSSIGQVVTVTGINAVMVATAGTLGTDPSMPDLPSNMGPAGRHPTYRHFICGDGKWIACGALGAKFERAVLVGLGLEETVLNDPRIAGVTGRMVVPENMAWALPKIREAFASRPSDELLEILSALGIPCGPVLSREEWFDHPQVAAIGMHVEVSDAALGVVQMPGVPLNLTKTPGSVRTAAPRRGEHNGVRPWKMKPGGEARAPRYVEGPLAGFRVLNTGTFVATPYAGFLLRELGADVIKVEPLTGDPFRVTGYTYNRGMRSLAIDLQAARGQAAFHRLAAVSDIVIDGMRPGVMAKLHIDYDTLAAINPKIVTMSLSAFGEGGPLGHQPGVDMVIQAMSGMMSSWGGPNDAPIANTIAINDVTTAAISALSCILGLYNRQVTGEGQRTWDSLAATSVILQMNDIVRFSDRPAAPIGHADLRGLAPLRSHYKTANGWLYVDTHPGIPPQIDAVLQTLHAEDLIGDTSSGTTAEVELATSLSYRTSSEAVDALERAGLRATRSRPVSEVLRDPTLLDAEMVHIRSSDTGGSFMMTGRYAAFSRTQRRGPMDPPGTGQHTMDVLIESGFDEDQIQGLVEADVVRLGGGVTRALAIPYR